MRVSIAMATYNGAKYLQEQLASFAEQTRRPDELVASDDGSDDETIEILEAFSRSAPFPVRIIQNETTLGYAGNFESAIKLCEGDTIFLSDQDDKWLPQKIEMVTQVFRSEPATYLVLADMVLADEELRPSSRTQLGNIIAAGESSEKFCAGCGMAIRRSLLPVAFPFPVHMFQHDSWLNSVAFALGVRKLITEPLQLYRRHGKNASNSLLSRTGRVSQLDLVLAAGLDSAAKGWAQQISRYRYTRNRLIERVSILERLGLEDNYEAALRRFDQRIENLEKRLELVGHPRRKRWLRIAELWRAGGYADFAGWKSAVKDLIRP